MKCPKCGSDNVLASHSKNTGKCLDCGYKGNFDDFEEIDWEGERAGYSRAAEVEEEKGDEEDFIMFEEEEGF